MEQNKTLLIIVSVALFLATILSIGLWCFYPREDVAGSPDTDPHSAALVSDDPIEWVRRNEIPALTPQPEGISPKEDLIIVYGEDPGPAAAPPPPAVAPPSPYPPAAPQLVPPPPSRKEAPAASAPPEKPRVRVPAPPAAAPPVAYTARGREFSIQVGAFSSRDRAEELNEVLKEKGLMGQVVYADGPKLYRLRIGPYTNKDEAEKFLGWVRTMNGFESSMIFERNAVRATAN
ncbi:MAG: SPOR domain-containing protein [Spirochaetales bacterium]|jgi:cell division septation protein DedD|nr:SPOR domain-containing protein [Spirochaetales bacterium]